MYTETKEQLKNKLDVLFDLIWKSGSHNGFYEASDKLKAHIERLEAEKKSLKRQFEKECGVVNGLCRQRELLKSQLATYKAVVDAMKTIKGILGYGIYGCPTNGEYHRDTYKRAFGVAKQALQAVKEMQEKGVEK